MTPDFTDSIRTFKQLLSQQVILIKEILAISRKHFEAICTMMLSSVEPEDFRLSTTELVPMKPIKLY
jgi:hypothetical protein